MVKATRKKGGKARPRGQSSRKSGQKATRGHAGASISVKTYRALRAAYLETQSIRSAAKAAGVRFETAKKYIMDGRPDRNMPAIADFARSEAKKDEAELELDLRTFRRQYQAEVREALAGSLIEIRLHNARTKTLADRAAAESIKPTEKREVIEPSSYFLHQVVAHEKLIHLMERSMGAADETISVKPTDFTAKMTAEECVKYIRTGEIPEHLR